jgi:VWFA-related protein
VVRPLLLSALLILGQQALPPPTQPFRSGAQVVEVDVRVFADGRFVTDLNADDFQISEDGVPQQIQSVLLISASQSPAPAPSTQHQAPGTGHPAPGTQHPGVWLFVFDTTHLTPGPFQRAREAAAKFVAEKWRDGDVGGVVINGVMANNRLTTEHKELKAAIEAAKMPGDLRSRQLELREWPRFQDEFEVFRIVENDREAIRTAVGRACSDDPDACRRGPPDVEIREKARRMSVDYLRATSQTLTMVNALCNGLARVPGAKTVVFFSEGFVIQQMESTLRQVTGQAARAGAHFYTIDARGLNKGPSSQIIDQARADSAMGTLGGLDAQADGTNSLAIDTGGFAIRNENNFTRALDEIQQDAGTYYVVAYAPSNGAFDGKYRAIGVKVSRPNVKVRARRGYLALPPAALTIPGAAVPPKRIAHPPAKADVPDKSSSETERTGVTPPALASVPSRTVSIDTLRALDERSSAASGEDRSASARLRPGAGDSGTNA